MNLKALFDQMHQQAKRQGKSKAKLRGGVKVIVRVKPTATTVAVWRPKKKLGDTEISVFRDYFGVPTGAKRLPPAGQQERWDEITLEAADGSMEQGRIKWYGVAWRWQGGQG